MPIFKFLMFRSAENQPVQSPDSVIAAAAGLVGDMATLYGATVAQVLDMNKVCEIVMMDDGQ